MINYFYCQTKEGVFPFRQDLIQGNQGIKKILEKVPSYSEFKLLNEGFKSKKEKRVAKKTEQIARRQALILTKTGKTKSNRKYELCFLKKALAKLLKSKL